MSKVKVTVNEKHFNFPMVSRIFYPLGDFVNSDLHSNAMLRMNITGVVIVESLWPSQYYGSRIYNMFLVLVAILKKRKENKETFRSAVVLTVLEATVFCKTKCETRMPRLISRGLNG